MLQTAGRTPNAEVARRLGMAPSAVLERIRKLEARGAIRGYRAILDPAVLHCPLTAFIRVTAIEPLETMSAGEQMARLPEVQEVHWVSGEDCYLIKVRLRDAEALGEFLRERLGPITGMTRTQSTIVLSTLKDTAELPLLAG